MTPFNLPTCAPFTHKAMLMSIVFTILLVSSSPHAANKNSYFNMTESKSDNLTPFTKWTTAMERYALQIAKSDDDCGKEKYHPCVVKEWRVMIEQIKSKPLRQQIEIVNQWANAHPYIVDQLNWGMEDFWETPYEFMDVSGDCEDYAIAKYYTLRATGVPEDSLRIIIVQDFNLGGIIHAVLGVYYQDDLLILDNQAKQVRPAMSIYHYRPIYGVNEDTWWSYTPLS